MDEKTLDAISPLETIGPFRLESIRQWLEMKQSVGALFSENYRDLTLFQPTIAPNVVEQMLDNDLFEGIYVVRNGSTVPMTEQMFDKKGDYIY